MGRLQRQKQMIKENHNRNMMIFDINQAIKKITDSELKNFINNESFDDVNSFIGWMTTLDYGKLVWLRAKVYDYLYKRRINQRIEIETLFMDRNQSFDVIWMHNNEFRLIHGREIPIHLINIIESRCKCEVQVNVFLKMGDVNTEYYTYKLLNK